LATVPRISAAIAIAVGLASHTPGADLRFIDEYGKQSAISAAELEKLERISAKVTDRDNQAAEYQGVRLADLLQSRGVVLGRDLRGARVANYLLLEASDGYRVVLALAEVDPATTDKVVLLADRKNGMPLPEKEGPWRLVIPAEKRPVRWIRMLQRISVQSPAVEAK
jgi:hypothetical protein